MPDSAGIQPNSSLPCSLSAWSTAAVLIGSTIGSGIFRVPSVTAAEGGSVGAVALLWVVGALLTLFGALTVAELATLFPRPGGSTFTSTRPTAPSQPSFSDGPGF